MGVILLVLRESIGDSICIKASTRLSGILDESDGSRSMDAINTLDLLPSSRAAELMAQEAGELCERRMLQVHCVGMKRVLVVR